MLLCDNIIFCCFVFPDEMLHLSMTESQHTVQRLSKEDRAQVDRYITFGCVAVAD